MNPINTDRLRDLQADDHTGVVVAREPLPAFGGKHKPHKPHKPKPPPPPPPPPPGPRLSRSFLFVFPEELAQVDARAMGATDIITHVPQRLIWAGSEADIRMEAARLLALAHGVPVTIFYWSWGEAARQNPWEADSATWQGFLGRLRAWKSAGIKGAVMDCEDEGRVAKRDPHTGAIVVPWWPAGPLMATRAKEYAAALSGVEVGVYAMGFMQASPYGFNGTLHPPTLPAAGWFDFCRALPAGWRWFTGDTYKSDSDAAITGVRSRWTGSGALQIGSPRVVPGSYVEAANLADLSRRLGLVAAARRQGGELWFYCDPQTLTKADVRAKIQAALR